MVKIFKNILFVARVEIYLKIFLPSTTDCKDLKVRMMSKHDVCNKVVDFVALILFPTEVIPMVQCKASKCPFWGYNLHINIFIVR